MRRPKRTVVRTRDDQCVRKLGEIESRRGLLHVRRARRLGAFVHLSPGQAHGGGNRPSSAEQGGRARRLRLGRPSELSGVHLSRPGRGVRGVLARRAEQSPHIGGEAFAPVRPGKLGHSRGVSHRRSAGGNAYGPRGGRPCGGVAAPKRQARHHERRARCGFRGHPFCGKRIAPVQRPGTSARPLHVGHDGQAEGGAVDLAHAHGCC